MTLIVVPFALTGGFSRRRPNAGLTAEVHEEAVETSMRRWKESGMAPIRTRSRQELIRFFDRLERWEPGMVSCSLWRPDASDVGTHVVVHQYGGVGRKP